MKQNKAIASTAYDLAYSLEIVLRDPTSAWMTVHGMCGALKEFANILYARKSAAKYHDMLLSVMTRMLDLKCAWDQDSRFYSPAEARDIAALTQHVFYRISTGEDLDQQYLDLIFDSIKRNRAA